MEQFDLSQYELQDTTTFTPKAANGVDELLGNDGKPVVFEVYSPGSPEGVKALHKSGRQAQMRMFRSMRGEFDPQDAVNADRESAEKLAAFTRGEIRVLVTKPSICGFGMNWQHCADTGFVGLNDSFEQVYQAVRRFWRYGQTQPVTVHFVAASTEGAVLENLRRKEADAERMGAAMVAQMADLSSELVHGANRNTDAYSPTLPVALPDWLTREAT